MSCRSSGELPVGNSELHRRKVERLKNSLARRERNQGPFCLSRGKNSPNTMRRGDYKKGASRLDMRDFDAIIEVNIHDKSVLVEPKATMEQLFNATAPFGLIPRVLPEFRGITVGGAINGAALESSSFRYGQFNDTCVELEVILGDGRSVKASREENSDLFFGLSGSYGSMGIITSAKISLVEAKPFVLVSYHHAASAQESVLKMQKLSLDPSTDFLEAIAYQKDSFVIIAGKMVEKIPEGVPSLDLSKPWSPWFFQHVQSAKQKEVFEEGMPLEDYLFRHDRAAFWMGRFALYPKLLLRYVLELLGFRGSSLDERLFLCEKDRIKAPLEAGFLFRLLFGWLMGSKRLYWFLHSGTEKWFSDHFCIQDYYLPGESVDHFVGSVFSSCGLSPLWICPVLSTNTPQFLSPHYRERDALLFDVGVYGMPQKNSGMEAVKELDALSSSLGGKKMFYGFTFQSEEEFWKIYPKDLYDQLRERFGAKAAFPSIIEKVLSG